MKLAHNITVSVFVKEDEDYNQIKQTFISLIPLDLEKEKLKLEEHTAEGIENAEIKTISLILKKNKHVNEFLNTLTKRLTKEQKQLLLNQFLTRVDEDLNFFIRLKKDKLINNEFEITDSGDCFHLKINLACFPKSNEAGKNILKQILEL